MIQTGAGTWKARKFLDGKNTAYISRPILDKVEEK